MGRFYKTAKPQFVRDNTFMPNLDLQTLLTQQKIKSNALKTELLSNVPDIKIDYWDVDKDRVTDLKSNYENKISDLTSKISSSPDNTNSYLPQMKELTRELRDSFTSGDIYNIQENAKGKRQFDANLAKLKNPADRMAYTKMVDDYLQNNPDGAASGIFKPEEMFDSRNIFEEYTKSAAFKALKPETIKQALDKSKGGYNIKESVSKGGLSKTRLGQNYAAWLKEEGLESYAGSREKYFGEKWFDENGEFDFSSEGHLGAVTSSGVESLAYENVATDFSKTANPFALANNSLRNQKKMFDYKRKFAGKEKVPGLRGAFTKDMEAYYKNTKEGRKAYIAFENNLKSIAGISGDRNLSTEAIISAVENSGSENQKKQLQRVLTQFNENMTAGSTHFKNIDPKTAEYLDEVLASPKLKSAQKNVPATLSNIKLPSELSGVDDVGGKIENGMSSHHLDNIDLQGLLAGTKDYFLGKDEELKIENFTLVEDSYDVVPGAFIDDNGEPLDGLTIAATFEIDGTTYTTDIVQKQAAGVSIQQYYK